MILSESHSRIQEKLEAVSERVCRRFEAIMLAATPSEAVEALTPFVEQGVTYFTLVVGNDLETLQLLIQHVLPELELFLSRAASALSPLRAI